MKEKMKKQSYELGNLHLELSLDDVCVLIAAINLCEDHLRYDIENDPFGCTTDLDELKLYLVKLAGGVAHEIYKQI